MMDWDTIKTYWDALLKLVFHPVFASFVGSLLSLKWVPLESWWGRFTSAAFAFVLSIYVSPWLWDLFHITAEKSQSAISVFVALFGLNFCVKALEGLKQVEFGKFFQSALDSLLFWKK